MGAGALTAQMTVALGCRALDDLLGGGVEEGCITLLHGEAGSGKTNFCLQLGGHMLSHNAKTILRFERSGASLRTAVLDKHRHREEGMRATFRITAKGLED